MIMIVITDNNKKDNICLHLTTPFQSFQRLPTHQLPSFQGCLAAALVTALKLCYVPFEAKGAREDLGGDIFLLTKHFDRSFF